jgi:hypothetical protein
MFMFEPDVASIHASNMLLVRSLFSPFLVKSPQGKAMMSFQANAEDRQVTGVVLAVGEQAIFQPGEVVRVLTRSPIGHYRVPTYVRGKEGKVEAVIQSAAVDNEQEGFGRNAGSKLHYYRVAIPMRELWPDYVGCPGDGLRIEIFETWLERIAQ